MRQKSLERLRGKKTGMRGKGFGSFGGRKKQRQEGKKKTGSEESRIKDERIKGGKRRKLNKES